METAESLRLRVPLAATFAAPFGIWRARRDPNRREAVSFAAAAL